MLVGLMVAEEAGSGSFVFESMSERLQLEAAAVPTLLRVKVRVTDVWD